MLKTKKFEKAMLLIEDENFEEALPLLKELNEENPKKRTKVPY